MKIHKFNEVNDIMKKISNDRVTQIITDLEAVSNNINQNLDKTREITKELDGYITKDSKNNTQVDDAYVNFESLNSKMADLIKTINAISIKLKDYTETGEDKIY